MSEILNVIVMVAAAVYVLFLPGFVLTFVFFRRGAVDMIERLALSFALSIAVVPLVAFYLNLVGVRLSRLNVIIEVLLIMALSGIFIVLRSSKDLPEAKTARLKGSTSPTESGASNAAPAKPAGTPAPPKPAASSPPARRKRLQL